eukprot:gene13337-15758_t
MASLLSRFSVSAFVHGVTLLTCLVFSLVQVQGAEADKSLTAAQPSIVNSSSNSKTVLVVYSYFEYKRTSGYNARDDNLLYNSKGNLEYFLRHAVTEDKSVTYAFIVNGFYRTVAFPNQSNVMVYERENSGYEFGAYSNFIEKHLLFVQSFSAYIFIQCSLRGPFLPNYETRHWTSLWVNQLSDTVKLVGGPLYCRCKPFMQERSTTASPWAYASQKLHLHGPILATDQVGLELLRPLWRTAVGGDKELAIEVEIESTGKILRRGWNIRSQLLLWKGVDFQNTSQVARKCRYLRDNSRKYSGELGYPGKYMGLTVEPLEMMFIKTNRGLQPRKLALYTNWTDWEL